MRICGLAWILAGGIGLGDAAYADEACQGALDTAAASFRDKAAQTDRRHIDRLASMLEKSTSRMPTDEAAALEQVIATLIARRSPDDARRAYIDNTLAVMTDANELLKAGVECSDKSTIRKTYDANLDTYRAVLDQIHLDVEERLSIENLGADEGLVVLAVNSDEFIHHAVINRVGSVTGSITFGPLRPGEYFRVVKAKRGTYVWDEIMQRRMMRSPSTWKWVEGKRRYELAERDFRFTVTAGKLNYVGVFMLETIEANYYRPSFNDRLTIVVTALEQRYPGLLEQHEFANGLYPDDRFTSYYLAEKRLRNEANADVR